MRYLRIPALVLALAAGLSQGPALAAGGGGSGPAAPAAATDPAVARVGAALQLRDVFGVMAEEGAVYGRSVEQDLFPDRGGAAWAAEVTRIYAPERVYPVFLAAFSQALAGNPHLPEIERFLSSDLARRATGLEISARRAMLDPAVDEAARMKAEELASLDDPHYRRVNAFIEANDLIETNVAGGLNAARAFYQGLSDGGALGTEMTEDDLLREVWAQEPAIRDEARSWLGALLTMAYAPMPAEELDDYTAFFRGEAGKALNRALFSAYDAAFGDVSRRLGLAAAGFIAGETL